MYMTDKQVADRFGISRVTVWRWRKTDPAFPAPITLSAGCVRWRLSEIEAWETQKATAA
jgi:prophage regulatory protein